jgi:tryptophan halogenase
MKNIKKIAIAGAGTAGFVSALILKTRFPEMQVDMIYSKNIGIVGVGEGSTEHWKEFMTFVGISHFTIIKECDATYKAGIMFQNWTEKDYCHTVQHPFSDTSGQYRYYFARQIANGFDSKGLSSKRLWNSRADSSYADFDGPSPTNQYHFNTNKLNEFLTKLASERGINLIDDEILDVSINEHGNIDLLKGNKQDYTYDFYIDCTGFKRALISKLGAKWQSYGKYLKMKAAIAFPTEDTETYNAWTLARAMDYGWMFRIPVWGRGGNGYIYDSDYINVEQAKAEAEAYLGHEINIGKEFKFDPGCVDRAWINNCVAIGLSANFVEPLEATSIGTSIQQAFLLMHRLPNYDQKVIDGYNKSVNDIMINIRDFVLLHYLVKKDNSQFWKDIQALEIPDSLKELLEIWKHKLPINEDFSNFSDYILFRDANFIHVLHGLGMFDTNSIKREYEMISKNIRENADRMYNEELLSVAQNPGIPHKQLLTLIRRT